MNIMAQNSVGRFQVSGVSVAGADYWFLVFDSTRSSNLSAGFPDFFIIAFYPKKYISQYLDVND
jgi:hypothetical protein